MWVKLGKETFYDSAGIKMVPGSGWLHLVKEIRPESSFTRLVELQRHEVIPEATEYQLKKLISSTVNEITPITEERILLSGTKQISQVFYGDKFKMIFGDNGYLVTIDPIK